jgi:hypothetical protein
MSKANGAVAWAVAIANNPAHGYDQKERWGPDYDCSSLVISAWESVGVAVREAGASYTGNMRKAFLACGFKDVTNQVNLATGAGMQPGDVLLNDAAHTAMVVQPGLIVAARINEQGHATGGQTGDQTGREICQQNYYNYPWNCVLRYVSDIDVGNTGTGMIEDKPAAAPESTVTVKLPILRQGMTGDIVKSMQGILIARGFSVGPDRADGDFGYNTRQGVLNFQRSKHLALDGIVGHDTWAALLGVVE